MSYDDFLEEAKELADKIADNIYLSPADKEKTVWVFLRNINVIVLYLKDRNEYEIEKQMYSVLLGKGVVKQEDADWQLSTLKDQIILRHKKAVKAYREIEDLCDRYKVRFKRDGYLDELLAELC